MTKEKSDFLITLSTSVIFLLNKEANGDNDLLISMYRQFLEDMTNPKKVENIFHTIFEVDGKFTEEYDKDNWVKFNGSTK